MTTCTDPQFRYIAVPGWWSPCLTCGELAWSHPRADPLADLRNTMRLARYGGTSEDYPPTMRPLPAGHPDL